MVDRKLEVVKMLMIGKAYSRESEWKFLLTNEVLTE